ncbi:MAG: 4Fe-4S binding protein [Dehalococcoidia bacterium]|nr:4Fe-4S binding protein [Dehalococcoidia bacterium]
MDTKEVFKTAIGTLFRLFPLPVEPGLRVVGHPNESSPVFVTANFALTVKRLTRYLKDLDCYLLVAPTKGINVWCAAKGGSFTAHSVISVIKTSGIGSKVTNRRLILPQLAAPGVDTGLVRQQTGWSCKFGPVYAKDIPEYIANGLRKTDAMRRVKWDIGDRIDIGIGSTFPFFLLILVILAIFLRTWLVEFVVLGWGLLLLMYGLYPFIPGRAGWQKLLSLEALLAVGLLAYTLLATSQSWYIRDLFIMAMGLIVVIGIDFGGVTPLYKSDLDPLLDKIGIRRIGPVDFGGRAKIIGGKIALNQTNCTACGICYDVCPRGVYEMGRGERKGVAIKYPELCEACEACVVQCPEEALSFRTS